LQAIFAAPARLSLYDASFVEPVMSMMGSCFVREEKGNARARALLIAFFKRSAPRPSGSHFAFPHDNRKLREQQALSWIL
jgi:hypothetical protein